MVVVACGEIVRAQTTVKQSAKALNLLTLLYRRIGGNCNYFKVTALLLCERSEDMTQPAEDVRCRFGLSYSVTS